MYGAVTRRDTTGYVYPNLKAVVSHKDTLGEKHYVLSRAVTDTILFSLSCTRERKMGAEIKEVPFDKGGAAGAPNPNALPPEEEIPF
jgi:hypothetical protein